MRRLYLSHSTLRLAALLTVILASLATQFSVQASTLIVTTNADSGAGSLRQAIATASPGDTINFAAGLAGQTITLTSGELEINQNLTITGLPGQVVTISGNHTSRIFCVYGGVTVNISNLVITNGSATATANCRNVSGGGGIMNNGATVNITSSTISNNSAATSCGGIWNLEGFTTQATLTLSNSTVSGNSALYVGGVCNNSASLTITNSTISGNSATSTNNDGVAGGIGNDSNMGRTGTINITNSTIAGNSVTGANGKGGGIYQCSAASGGLPCTITIVNSTISGNSASVGGGFYNDTGGTANPTNTIIAGNTGRSSDPDAYGIFATGGYNLIGNATGSSGWVGTDRLSAAPSLGTLTGNPAYYPLLAGSAAINGGTNSICPSTDEVGTARPQGGVCDIGAYEYQFSAPTISAAFSPATVALGNPSTLTFTISNPNASTPLTGVGFSDSLPTTPGAMVIASPNGLNTNGCGSPTIGAAAGSASITFSGGTISGASCTVSVNVMAPSAGAYATTSSVVTANEISGTTTASASLSVNPATHLGISAPASATAGTAFNFTVTALDVSNNQVPGYTGTVHFTSSDGAASLPADYTFTGSDAGSHQFNATLNGLCSQSLTATDTLTSTITGTQNIAVSAAVGITLTITNVNDNGAGSLRQAVQ